MGLGLGLMAPIHGAGQTLTTGATSVSSTALPAGTMGVKLRATADCFVNIGQGAAVATTDMFLALGSTEFYPASPGQVVSAIQSSAAGSLYVTPMN